MVNKKRAIFTCNDFSIIREMRDMLNRTTRSDRANSFEYLHSYILSSLIFYLDGRILIGTSM